MDGRRLQIDTLRGLACVALVTFHTIGIDRTSGLRVADEHALRLLQRTAWLPANAAVRVSLGSGLRVAAGRAATRKHSSAPKVRRLLVPMLSVGTLFAILQANTPAGRTSPATTGPFCTSSRSAHYWFLESLFLIFLVIVFAEQRRWLVSRASFAAVWLASAAASTASTRCRATSACKVPSICCRSSCSASAAEVGDAIADSRARSTARRAVRAGGRARSPVSWLASSALGDRPRAGLERSEPACLSAHARSRSRARAARHLLVLDLPVPQASSRRRAGSS